MGSVHGIAEICLFLQGFMVLIIAWKLEKTEGGFWMTDKNAVPHGFLRGVLLRRAEANAAEMSERNRCDDAKAIDTGGAFGYRIEVLTCLQGCEIGWCLSKKDSFSSFCGRPGDEPQNDIMVSTGQHLQTFFGEKTCRI